MVICGKHDVSMEIPVGGTVFLYKVTDCPNKVSVTTMFKKLRITFV